MARYYASRSGRFMTPDPGHVGAFPEDPQSWNAYTYGANDPINYSDPNGAYRVRIQSPGDCWSSLGGRVEEVSLGLERYTEGDTRQEGGRIIVNVEEGWREVFEYYCTYSVADIAHTALDVAGFVPVIGEIADLANAGIYAAQGDAFNAGVSLAAMVPVIGSVGTGGRVAAKGIAATRTIRSAAQKRAFLKQLADDPKTASWMKPWLRQGRNPPGHVVDHRTPLSVGGVPGNMRLMLQVDHNLHHRFYGHGSNKHEGELLL